MGIKGEGKPVAGATVEVRVSKSHVLTVTADENGVFPEITIRIPERRER